jgi:hypothetical protein
MQLRVFSGFHSGINNLIILLLYEAMLLGKWLQTFRQAVRVSFSKGQILKTILPVENVSKITEIIIKCRGDLNKQLLVSRGGWGINVQQ